LTFYVISLFVKHISEAGSASVIRLKKQKDSSVLSFFTWWWKQNCFLKCHVLTKNEKEKFHCVHAHRNTFSLFFIHGNVMNHTEGLVHGRSNKNVFLLAVCCFYEIIQETVVSWCLLSFPLHKGKESFAGVSIGERKILKWF
jgi:hypothetical protein